MLVLAQIGNLPQLSIMNLKFIKTKEKRCGSHFIIHVLVSSE